MQLQPILLSMNNLMSGRLFRIPEYQRAYAWGKKQDDIMAAAKLTIVDDITCQPCRALSLRAGRRQRINHRQTKQNIFDTYLPFKMQSEGSASPSNN